MNLLSKLLNRHSFRILDHPPFGCGIGVLEANSIEIHS
jgi:hypothetical protein